MKKELVFHSWCPWEGRSCMLVPPGSFSEIPFKTPWTSNFCDWKISLAWNQNVSQVLYLASVSLDCIACLHTRTNLRIAFVPPLLRRLRGMEIKDAVKWGSWGIATGPQSGWQKIWSHLFAIAWSGFVEGLIHKVKVLCSCPVCLCATETTEKVLRENNRGHLFSKRYFSQIP